MLAVLRHRLPRPLLALAALCVAFSVAPTGVRGAPRADFSPADEEIIRQRWPDAATTPSGLRFVILKEGQGPKPRLRERLSVVYEGSLINGKVFNTALDPKEPFVFVLGTRRVIAGWEEAFADMRVGEKRTIIIPYSLGYGLLGRPPDIPNRATLIFDVELLSIE